MEVCFFFGPEKIPFRVIDYSTVESDSAIPFHGIISRGLLIKFIEHNLNVQLWHKYAHLLTDNIEARNLPELEEIRNYVQECKILSFDQSSFCVQQYVVHHCVEEKIQDAQIELWNVKEGHTSSVWRVCIASKEKLETFAVNVARDYEAGLELKDSSEKMRIIAEKFPGINLAKVFDIFILRDKSLPSPVVVTRNEWIENSYEIHSRKNKQTKEDELLMVERFLTDKNNPAHITSVLGRIFTSEESRKIKNDINDFLTHATAYLPVEPKIKINDGDVVWDGEKATVVALS